VDDFGRTSAASIFAIGDVTGIAQLAHAATSQGVTAAENAVNPKKRKMEKLVPACIFTSPEIGSVGLTEQQAKEKGLTVKTGKFGFAHLGKAMAAGETNGFVKWVADAATGQLLGAHAVGLHATELISEATAAVRAELTAEELGRTIHCHPTLSETWMEAAHALLGHCIHAPPARK
jgi:dihydrolipoamide dehydrogenase